jgi:hypothetical protein
MGASEMIIRKHSKNWKDILAQNPNASFRERMKLLSLERQRAMREAATERYRRETDRERGTPAK